MVHESSKPGVERGTYTDSPFNAATRLVRKGWLRELPERYFVLTNPAESQPDWIWLPNSLVTSADGEVPPIERVRQTQDIAALRLFIDLYHVHNLADDGGVNWRPSNGFRQEFVRLPISETHEYSVWGFKPDTERIWTTSPLYAPHHDAAQKNAEAFWNAWRVLKAIGLVQMVAHLVEADSADGEPIHPLPHGDGEEGERAISEAACRAATAMGTARQIEWAKDQGATIMVPALKHIANVQVVGIIRLRHRPHTYATAAWYANASEWAKWAHYYEALAAEAQARRQPRYATSR